MCPLFSYVPYVIHVFLHRAFPFFTVAGKTFSIECNWHGFQGYSAKLISMKMKTFIASVCVCAAVTLLSCKKENESSTLRIHMTDAPVDVEEVNIDLIEVRVNFN